MKRDAIVTEARAWVGTPWRHQAALRGVGCDCIGLIAGVALALGSVEARAFMGRTEYREYGRQPDPAMMLRACTELLDPIAQDEALPGDVFLMRFNAEPQHFALLSTQQPEKIIHAYAQARRVVEHHLDAVWKRRILRAYRLRGIA